MKFLKKQKELSSFILLKEEKKSVYISIEDKDLNHLIEILSDLEVNLFSNRKESLEDYFMKFYKEDKDFGGALK